MRYLGVGLSRTGTTSLYNALNLLGLRTLHWEPERLRDVVLGQNVKPDFRRYGDVDAVTDLPAALFYRELLDAYPGCKLILTIREPSSWWHSVRKHYEVTVPKFMSDKAAVMSEEAAETQKLAYGSERLSEFIYKKRFTEHNMNVLRQYPDTLVMNLFEGDGWDKLCSFLNMPVPSRPFPKLNGFGKNRLL